MYIENSISSYRRMGTLQSEKWVNSKDMLSEVSQIQKDKHCMVTLRSTVWNTAGRGWVRDLLVKRCNISVDNLGMISALGGQGQPELL